MSLNESQQRIADTIDGMIVVDAGPGTGKTHTVVTRCINIIRQKDFDPKDLVMLTFTKNAAAEMRERVQKTLTKMFSEGGLERKEYESLSSTAKKMNIGTFDSFCLSVVKQSPMSISKFFGTEEMLTRNAGITENDSINRTYFERFLNRFLDEKGKDYGDLAAIASESPDEVYLLINRLMSRGIIPMKNTDAGRKPWFGENYGKDLVGDVKALRELMDSFEGLDKNAAKKFEDVPDAENFVLSSKEPVPRMLDMAAEDDRTELIGMIHDIYYDYVCRSISDDHLTFGLVACFAFLVLYNDDRAREKMSARYLIVDEFQDTNSNQLMIALMVLKEPNLCVVGDWKQGIYGFRFVSIENITKFDPRVRSLRRFLNDDKVRIKFSIPDTITLPLVENYRSSQLVIDRAYESLYIGGTKTEVINKAELDSQVTMIESKRRDIGTNTAFECVRCDSKEGEVDETLRTIMNYIESDKYVICNGDDKPQTRPRFKDIAILCRNTESCRRIYEACLEHHIPAFLQGEVGIMATEEGKLLLGWLRYISNDKDPWGIATILAHMNYPSSEIKWMIEYDRAAKSDHVPEYLVKFRKHLRSKKRRITELISEIFDFYGLDNDVTQAITAILSSAHRNSLVTIPDLIRSIERDIERDTKYDVDGLPESDAVTIQTMHKSKGLEYPIVIIPRIDSRTFPAPPTDKDMFSFSDLTGIRCRKEIIRFGSEKKIGDSWKSAVVRKSLKPDYSEERRLFFVAISRAKQYVTLIAGGKPTPFFTYYAEKYGCRNQGYGEVPVFSIRSEELIPRPSVPAFKPRRKILSVHDLLNFDFGSYRAEKDSDELGGKGMQYGTEVHKMAELIVKDIPFEESKYGEYPELVHVKEIVERLRSEGATEFMAEQECSLPLNDLGVTVRGVIDMIAFFPDRIEIHDWKTDFEEVAKDEYEVQLSIYAKVLRNLDSRPVRCYIDWIYRNKSHLVAEVDDETIRERARKFITVG